MTSYVTLAIEDPCQADDLLRCMREFPEHSILAPCLEYEVKATLVSAAAETCDCPRHEEDE